MSIKYLSRKELEDNFEVWSIDGIESWLVHKSDGIHNLLKNLDYGYSDVETLLIPYDKWSDHKVIYHEDPYRPEYNFYEEIHKILNNAYDIPYMISTTEY